jgi:hypothetical protein
VLPNPEAKVPERLAGKRVVWKVAGILVAGRGMLKPGGRVEMRGRVGLFRAARGAARKASPAA